MRKGDEGAIGYGKSDQRLEQLWQGSKGTMIWKPILVTGEISDE